MKQTHIYLVENCYGDKNKVYIGKTINPDKRKKMHNLTYGSQIRFTVIDSINSDKHRDWVPLESYWIEQFRNWGFKMMNVNTGGGGPEYFTEEIRLKISQNSKGVSRGKGRIGANKGKILSEETKTKMRKSRSKETRLKMSESHKGKSATEETKLKMTLARKQYWEQRRVSER